MIDLMVLDCLGQALSLLYASLVLNHVSSPTPISHTLILMPLIHGHLIVIL